MLSHMITVMFAYCNHIVTVKDNKEKYNLITKFLWFCSGANIEVLKSAKADQDRYAHIGFSIVLISILGGISGGYALSTVFKKASIIWLGGGFWGVILGSMDRFVLSGVQKRKSANWVAGLRDKTGGLLFFLLRLSISI